MKTKTKVRSKIATRTSVLVAVVLLSALVIAAYGVAFGLRRAPSRPANIAVRITPPAQPARCLGLKVAVENTPTLLKIATSKEVTFVIENPDRTCVAKINGAQFRISSDNQVAKFRKATLISGAREVPLDLTILPTVANASFAERDVIIIQPGGKAKLRVVFETSKDADKPILVEIPKEGLTWRDVTGYTFHDPVRSVIGVIEGKAGTEVTERTIEIKDLAVTLPDPHTAIISFVTNVPATSEIEYDTTSDLNSKVAGSAVGKNHSYTLNVTPDTQYYYRVTAKSSDFFPATTPVYTFKTAQEDNGVNGGGTGGTGATVDRPTGGNGSTPTNSDDTGAESGR
ncbi:fibronectin type III domain-containing protein [Patescibacteria group bacterium]|nr:fibronectin type III domain-containing protein [Patescibacteria group bacterium]MBU1908288.1 fibronectin type III domain-containing protein [Patescibacteria group bacterium]